MKLLKPTWVNHDGEYNGIQFVNVSRPENDKVIGFNLVTITKSNS